MVYVEVLKKHCNVAGWTFCDAIFLNSIAEAASAPFGTIKHRYPQRNITNLYR